ncbi:leptin receptor [Gastrophryne carolinensis]
MRTQQSLCLWAGTDQQLSFYNEYRQLIGNFHSTLPSNIHITGSDPLPTYLYYLLFLRQIMALALLEEAGHRPRDVNNSHGEQRGADCRCSGYVFCECDMAPYEGTYILWMEIVTPNKALLSHPISIDTSAILKPESPSDLSVEIRSDGRLKVLWSHPLPAGPRLQYQVKHYFNTSDDSSQSSVITEKRFVLLDVAESCSPLVFEVRCRISSPPGVWSDWSQPIVFRSQDGFYFPQTTLVSSGSTISIYCMFCQGKKKVPSESITWGLNLGEKIPSSQYTAVSRYVSKVTLANLNTTKPKGKFSYDALYCCTRGDGCQPRYAKIYAVDVNINITCETLADASNMTCRWSTLHMDSLKDSNFTFRYYEDYNYCLEKNLKYYKSTEKSCELQEDGYYECKFYMVKSTSSYYMWLEIQHPEGSLRSTPFCVRPIEVVRPFSPSDIQAEMMVGTGYLHVIWKPRFAGYDLVFQLRYRVGSPKSDWKVLDIFNNKSTTIKEVDSLKSYIVQVRCRKSDVSEYWSNWSEPVHTAIKDIRAPSRGPEFWRTVPNSLLQIGDNITLIWQPSVNSHLKYEVLYETSSILMVPVDVGNATNYTFTLQNNNVTVSVQARNSLGHSKINHKLTFSSEISTVQAVETLDVYLLNNSAVAVWTLLPVDYNVLELVLEWRNLQYESSGRWVFIDPNISRYYIDEHFYAFEKYQFSLTPVFAEGVGCPKITYTFSKEESSKMQNNAGFYVILPAITASSFLLVITLAISHQRMKRMFWKDIPNPKYCSWAQEVNFQKPDTLENLFIKHRNHLAHSFPLILEPEAIFENLNILKNWEKEDTVDISIVGKKTEDRDSACTTSQFSSSSTYTDNQETTLYSRSPTVQYATIIGNPQKSKAGISVRKLSVSSCDGGLLRNNSIVLGELERDKQALLIMAGLQAKQPSKISSNSTDSSEGFSEPSDEGFEGESPEKNLYYLGFNTIQNAKSHSYFSGNPLMTYHIQEKISYGTINFSPENSSEFINEDYSKQGLVKKSLRSYIPQLQIQSTTSTDMVGIYT